MFRKGLKILAVFALLAAFSAPAVLAADKPAGTYLLMDISSECFSSGNCTLCDLIQVGITGTNMILAFSATIALVLFIYGGTFFWLLSGGSQDKIKKGKTLMINTVIALVVILGAYTMVSFVYTTLKGNGQVFNNTCQVK